MNWWKLFALLVAVACCVRCAEGAKKKIRIHLPQKVKHIYHHKKIYITNHPASSQYAPAYLPSADGSVATSVAVSKNVLPLKSDDLYNDRPDTHGISSSTSKLLPLYKARGYYGPTPAYNDWVEEEDLVPPPEPTGPGYEPSAFSAPSAPEAAVHTPKRIKIIKIKQSPRKKKVIRKRKPKRIVHEVPPLEDEHPVSSFHEQFYSDLDGAGTIKKIRKPKRVEKIIDGDTEHIHTYSEEHIHKVVFDDGPKLPGLGGGNPIASMSGLSTSHAHGPLKSHQSLLNLNGNREYSSYNPREVTHDHVFHDHGEIPPNMDLPRDSLGFPPRVSYTSEGLKLAGAKKRPGRYGPKGVKSTRPITNDDFSYYENMYTANGKPRKPKRPTKLFDDSIESPLDDYRPVPSLKPRPKRPNYASSPYYGPRAVSKYHAQASSAIPYSTSSTIIHDSSESVSGTKATAPSGYANFKDPFAALKGVYSNSYGYGYDTYAAASNLFKGNGKHKSISTQNVSFGGQDHKTIVDHLAESSQVDSTIKENSQSEAQEQQFEGDYDRNNKGVSPVTPPTHYTVTDNTAAHDYFTAMALKAFQEDPLTMAEASNTNFQFAEAPSATPALTSEGMLATEDPRPFHRPRQSDSTPEPTSYEPENRKYTRRPRQRSKPVALVVQEVEGEEQQEHRGAPRAHYSRPRGRPLTHRQDHSDDTQTERGTFKYGDKI